MKKLVQLKNKENENLDPINSNYEERLQKLECTILYSNESGTTDDILLYDNVSNYSYIEIFYNKANMVFNSKKINNPNNKQIGLEIVFMEGNNYTQVVVQKVTFNNNKIIYGPGMWNNFTMGSSFVNSSQTEKQITITKVIGYK